MCENYLPESSVSSLGPEILLGDETLTTSAVGAFARCPTAVPIRLGHAAARRMADSVALRNVLVATGQPIYGVTTGFGDSARIHLSADKVAALQRNLVQNLLNGSGPDTGPDVVRATMLVRANCLAQGCSGVRPDVVELILEFLRHDIQPVIPERGSVGASGDLVPLSYLTDALTGRGQVRFRGALRDAGEVMAQCALTPVVLEAKEGLALINGTSFMAGFAVLAATDAGELALLADLCTALAVEALQGNRGHFNAVIHARKPHPGQVRSAARVRRLLAGSTMSMEHSQVLRGEPGIDGRSMVRLSRAIQDPYSLRCAPHVIGVLSDTLAWVEDWLDIEINSTNDNPLFDTASGDVHSGGNFYGGHVGQAMDALKIAVASVGDLLDRQLALVVDEKFNRGLPANLTAVWPEDDPEAGLHHGFKGTQIACSALAAEALKQAGPATVFSRSTEAHNQDKVSMGTIAARDACAVVELVQHITAIHLLAVCQAVELRGATRLGHGTQAVYSLIRDHVGFVDRDRRLDHDLATVLDLMRSDDMRQILRSHAPEENGETTS